MPPFSIFRLGLVLLVNIDEEIDDPALKRLHASLTHHIKETSAKGVLIDLHDMEILDSYMAKELEFLASLAGLLQARVALIGLSPEIATTLVDFGIRPSGVLFALDVEDALAKLGLS